MKRLYTKRVQAKPVRLFMESGCGLFEKPARPSWAWGLLFNKHAWWLGAHYSQHQRRHCVNLLPMLTLWVALPGGKEP